MQAANMMGGATTSSAATMPQGTSEEIIGAWLGETFSLSAETLEDVATAAPLVPPVSIGAQGQRVDLISTGSAVLPPDAVHDHKRPPPLAAQVPLTVRSDHEWVGRSGQLPLNCARSMLDTAAESHPRLESLRPYVERFERNGLVFYRARLAGLSALEEATEACT